MVEALGVWMAVETAAWMAALRELFLGTWKVDLMEL